MTSIILLQVWGLFIIVFKGYDQLFLLGFICAFLDSLWSILMHKDYFFPVFPLIYYSDWYFRVSFSLLTLMLLLRRIHPPTSCFSSALSTWVHCCNWGAQRKWWMRLMPGIIHWVTNHGIVSLCILHVFKIHCPGCQQKPLFVSRTVISLHRNSVPCRLVLFQRCKQHKV